MQKDLLIKTFTESAESIIAYNRAVDALQAIGFERILRQLGEPGRIPTHEDKYVQMSAAAQAEAVGWYNCIDMVFNFLDRVRDAERRENEPSVDFGATETLNRMNF